jgi:hypothetical protein
MQVFILKEVVFGALFDIVSLGIIRLFAFMILLGAYTSFIGIKTARE